VPDSTTTIEVLLLRRDHLRTQLSGIGDMRAGSLVERFCKCGKPSCHCAGKGSAGHGPSYSLTRPVAAPANNRMDRPRPAKSNSARCGVRKPAMRTALPYAMRARSPILPPSRAAPPPIQRNGPSLPSGFCARPRDGVSAKRNEPRSWRMARPGSGTSPTNCSPARSRSSTGSTPSSGRGLATSASMPPIVTLRSRCAPSRPRSPHVCHLRKGRWLSARRDKAGAPAQDRHVFFRVLPTGRSTMDLARESGAGAAVVCGQAQERCLRRRDRLSHRSWTG